MEFNRYAGHGRIPSVPYPKAYLDEYEAFLNMPKPEVNERVEIQNDAHVEFLMEQMCNAWNGTKEQRERNRFYNRVFNTPKTLREDLALESAQDLVQLEANGVVRVAQGIPMDINCPADSAGPWLLEGFKMAYTQRQQALIEKRQELQNGEASPDGFSKEVTANSPSSSELGETSASTSDSEMDQEPESGQESVEASESESDEEMLVAQVQDDQ